MKTPWQTVCSLLVCIACSRATYVDAACSYRQNSVICLSVFHTNEPCKMAEPIKMPFGLRTRVGQGNHVLDGGPDPPWEGANFLGRMLVPL